MASSMCTAVPPTIRGVHHFEIIGYSLIKGFSPGEYVMSDAFAVGGYRWSVRFYPGGFSRPQRAHVSAFLKVTSRTARAWARNDLHLLDRATGLSRSVHRAAEPLVFDNYSAAAPPKNGKSKRGACALMRRAELKAPPYLRGDHLTIECVIDVIVTSEADAPPPRRLLLALPPDLSKHLGDLLDQQDQMGVAFDVGAEVFRAHRTVLVVRLPVFMAGLYRGMKEEGMERVAIDDVQPVVFQALICFVYTDVLVLPSDLEGDDYKEMVGHLLKAVDRYGMERLKLMCESILCRSFDGNAVESILCRSLDGNAVETTLALADQHYCKAPNDACLQFMSLGLEG